jgi:hypothetical protein
MVMSKDEAQGIANEALRAIVTNQDFNNLKYLIGWGLDITDEILDEAVKVLFSKTEIVLDAKKFAIWINGLTAAPKALDIYMQYKTLWDIPFSYLPEYVFASGFEIARRRLPSDAAGIQISVPTAREIEITWINIPGCD